MNKTIAQTVIVAALLLPGMVIADDAEIKGNKSSAELEFSGTSINFSITWNDLLAQHRSTLAVFDQDAESDKLWWSLDRKNPDRRYRNVIDDTNAASGVEYFSLTGLADTEHTLYVYGKWEDMELDGRDRDYLRTAGSVSIAAAVPEPETYAMLLAGLGLMGAVVRRHGKKQA